MDEKLANLSPAQKRELLARLLKEKQRREGNARATAITKSMQDSNSSPAEFPLSAGQQALWYGYRRDPRQTAYNVFLPSRFPDGMDLKHLQQAVQTLVDRHDALRTTFGESSSDRHPIQRVARTAAADFQVIDAGSWSEKKLRRRVLAETQRPFDLSTGPLLRVGCFQVAGSDLVIVATTHHIVVDFWSLVLMMSEVEQLYLGHTLPPASNHYADFVASQTNLIKGSEGQRLTTFWTDQLAKTSPRLALPTDYIRPARFTHRADVQPFQLSGDVVRQINELAKRLHVTENAIVLAMLQATLARFSEQDSFAVGTPYSGRLHQRFENTVGFFVNVLPIAADVSNNPSLEDLSVQVGRRMVDALANEALPFAEMVRAVSPARDSSHHPLFQVSCTFEKSHLTEEQGRAGFLLGDDQVKRLFAGLSQESYFLEHPTCHYDLEFVFEFSSQRLRGMACYCRDLFHAKTIETLVDQFKAFTEDALNHPALPVKSMLWRTNSADTKRATALMTEPTDSIETETIRDLLTEQGSHEEWVSQAHRAASQLRELGVQSGDFVPVYMPRGRDAWVCLLGVMFSGATPIPIDSDQPAVSMETLLEDAACTKFIAGDSVVSSESRLTQIDPATLRLSTRVSDAEGPPSLTPTDLAYIIFTSGSTGRPKGVKVSHGAICNTLRWREKSISLTRSDRVLILLSHQFDASMAVVLSTIHQGATPVWPCGNSSSLDLDELVNQIIQEAITVLPAVPSLLRAISTHRRFAECGSLREIWSGGESLSNEVVEAYRRTHGCSVWNLYGPTEAAVEATAMHVTDTDPRSGVPIGFPIDGCRVLIVDAYRQIVPDGVPGEIAIGGRGLAEGYLNRDSMTKQKFVSLQVGNESLRVYLTGDRGRVRHDGSIEFLGRIDHQVKLRGYRIELEEIDAVLGQHPDVLRGAVKVCQVGQEDSLVAYVELVNRQPQTVHSVPFVQRARRGGPSTDASQATVASLQPSETDRESTAIASLRRFLSDKLPAYKRPQRVVALDTLPVGTSGKVLRDQLPNPPMQTTEATPAEQSPLERYLHKAFVKHLGEVEISDDENFFEAGGTSLQAAMLTSDLSAELNFSVPSSLLFDLGDVQSVAARLAQLHPEPIGDRFGEDSLRVSSQRRDELAMDSLLADFAKPHDRNSHAPNVFMIHPPGGIVICYRDLAKELSDDVTLVAVRSRGLHGDEPLPISLAEMAAEYVDAIRSRQPKGPYYLGGWSLGGVIAFEVARQLREANGEVRNLILLDSTVPEGVDVESASVGREYGLDFSLEQLASMSPEEQLPFLYEHADRLGVLDDSAPELVVAKFLEDLRRLFSCHVDLCRTYAVQAIDIPVLLFRPTEVVGEPDARNDRGWGRWVSHVEVQKVPGHHHSMVQSKGAHEMARSIAQMVRDN
ncbi:MAG: amino acid adenylation domain-containing protein [Planctomycetota bacterium]